MSSANQEMMLMWGHALKRFFYWLLGSHPTCEHNYQRTRNLDDRAQELIENYAEQQSGRSPFIWLEEDRRHLALCLSQDGDYEWEYEAFGERGFANPNHSWSSPEDHDGKAICYKCNLVWKPWRE